MSKRRERQHEEGEILISTYNNMLAEDGSLKHYCPECGLPRDVEFAKTNPCGACSTPEHQVFGTQKRPPQFDELGERIPDEVIAERNAARVARLQEANAAKRAANKQTKPVKTVKPQPVRKVKSTVVKQPEPVATSDLFLMMV